MAEKLEFDLKVGSNELTKAISDATTGSKKLGDTISTALGTFGGNVALKGFELLGRAVGNTTDFLLDSIDAAAEQESAFNKLAQSLRITGEFTQDAIQDFSDFADQLQRTSVFSDDVVIGQLAIAKSLGATNEQAKQLVQAAANLSATFGGSLEENVFKLGKTLGGVVSKELKVIIPEIKSLSEEAIKSAAVLKIVNDRFGGAASSELNTYAGSTIALKNAFNVLQAEIGSFVTGSTTVNTIIKGLTGTFQSLTGAVFGFRKEFQGISTESETNKKKISDLGNEYNRLKDAIDQARKPVFDLNAALATKEALQASGVKNISEAEIRLSQILKERVALRTQLNAIESKEEEKSATKRSPVSILTPEEIQKAVDAQNELYSQLDIAEADYFLAQQQRKFDASLLAGEASKVELETLLLFEQEKIDAKYAKELQLTELIKNEEDKRIAQRTISLKKINEIDQKELDFRSKLALAKAEEEKRILTIRNNYIQAAATIGAAFAKDGSKEAFLIQKAAAIAGIAIDDAKARTGAVAASAILPVGASQAYLAKQFALITSNTALAASTVAATAIKGFAEGGIVGATRGGDDQIAKVRTGEMVLNADQQKNLFDMINSGKMNQGNIVIEIDGREIMKVVRNQVRSGYSIA